MKDQVIKIIYWLVFLYGGLIYAEVPSSVQFIELVIAEDIPGMKLFFKEMEQNSPTLLESKIFLADLSKELAIFYGLPLSKLSSDRVSNKLEEKLKYYKGGPLQLQSMDLFCWYPVLWASPFLLEQKFKEEDFSANTVVGLVEILVGSLMCIIPYKPIQIAGGFIIGDGIARAGGAFVEIDEKNKKLISERENLSY